MQAERDRDVQQPVPDTIVDNRLDPVWGRAGATPTAPGNRQAGQWTRHSFGVICVRVHPMDAPWSMVRPPRRGNLYDSQMCVSLPPHSPDTSPPPRLLASFPPKSVIRTVL